MEPPIRRPRLASRLALPLVLASLGAGAGCDALRRASLKTVDPTIQKNPRWERERAQGGFRLGPYTALRPRVREHAGDGDLGVRSGMPRNPGWRYELQLTVRGPKRDYEAKCTGLRVPTVAADFGEIADVNNDEVKIECEIQGELRWRFTAQGRLDKNLGGELRPTDATAIAPLKVEILLWFARLKLIRRHLAAPIVQVRRGPDAIAALVIARPEWAWVAAGESDELRGVALTTTLAIAALPLGLEDS